MQADTSAFRRASVVVFLFKGLTLPFFGFGDLWFNNDVARGVGHKRFNLYSGVEELRGTCYNSTWVNSPAISAPKSETRHLVRRGFYSLPL